MLLIKLLTILADAKRRGNPGDQLLVDDEEGAELIRGGYAEIVMTGEQLEAKLQVDAKREADLRAELEAVEKARADFRAALLQGERPAAVLQAPAPAPASRAGRKSATRQQEKPDASTAGPDAGAGPAVAGETTGQVPDASAGDAAVEGTATDAPVGGGDGQTSSEPPKPEEQP